MCLNKNAVILYVQPLKVSEYRGGSQVIWIAPSGGRDRPDPLSGEWFPVSFSSFVDIFLGVKKIEKSEKLDLF